MFTVSSRQRFAFSGSMAIAFASAGLMAGSAKASITVGGIVFADNNAFADTLVSSTGTFTVSSGTLASAVVGSDTSDYAFSFDTGASLVLGFTNNRLRNGAGADLAVYELGTPDSFDLAVSVAGTTRFYTTTDTGTTSGGFNLNVAQINLDDFGLAAGATLSQIRVVSETNAGNGTVPSFTAFGAINSAPVPEPTLALGAALGIVAARRRTRRL